MQISFDLFLLGGHLFVLYLLYSLQCDWTILKVHLGDGLVLH